MNIDRKMQMIHDLGETYIKRGKIFLSFVYLRKYRKKKTMHESRDK